MSCWSIMLSDWARSACQDFVLFCPSLLCLWQTPRHVFQALGSPSDWWKRQEIDESILIKGMLKDGSSIPDSLCKLSQVSATTEDFDE